MSKCHEFCIKNKKFSLNTRKCCIKNKEFCVETDEFCRHCFYGTHDGERFPGRLAWQGLQGAREQGDRVSMLLDLEQGSITVWKNDVKLGVMEAGGLTGPLCWAVSMAFAGRSARIESAPAPPSQVEEELAAAKARGVYRLGL